jgi:hypothetical protein
LLVAVTSQIRSSGRQSLGADFDMKSLTLDFEPLRKLTDAVRNEFPVLQNAAIDEFRGGLPTMTPDGRLILDQVPGVNGFFVASGCCVGGLSVSPAVGEVLADWIVDGAPPLDLSLLGLRRFGPELSSASSGAPACGAMRITILPNRRTRTAARGPTRSRHKFHAPHHVIRRLGGPRGGQHPLAERFEVWRASVTFEERSRHRMPGEKGAALPSCMPARSASVFRLFTVRSHSSVFTRCGYPFERTADESPSAFAVARQSVRRAFDRWDRPQQERQQR